jgi:nitrate/TMAO reductase-like tetraheme cytochrome c subunit
MGMIMSNAGEPRHARGFIARLWTVLGRPSARFSLATLVIFGGVCGILLWGGFNWGMEEANTLQFCVSCHEMRDTVYQEYKQTIHYQNPVGVRAGCPDCHVPHDWFFKVRRKIQASNELLHKVLGTIDTPEKFEQHRLALAEDVWAGMKATNSRECRNCHDESAFDTHQMTEAARQGMMPGLQAGLTCIDCHKGIAHHLPKTPDQTEGQPTKQ